MARKTDSQTADAAVIEPDAMYRVELARPLRLAGIALHPNDPDITVSGAILASIQSAVLSFVKV